tara:strand:- start:561 stop:785 length:225 start_codon:yes stop_codon:yes gene_type:complete
MSVIIVKLTNVHKEEQETLKEYLDHNCWAWEETSKDELLPEPTDECMEKEPEKPKTKEEHFDQCLRKWGGNGKR